MIYNEAGSVRLGCKSVNHVIILPGNCTIFQQQDNLKMILIDIGSVSQSVINMDCKNESILIKAIFL